MVAQKATQKEVVFKNVTPNSWRIFVANAADGQRAVGTMTMKPEHNDDETRK